MISVHRQYELKGTTHFHAHIEVNPVGILDVEIIENKQHHKAELCDVGFKKLSGSTRVYGKQGKAQWALDLHDKDASELSHLIVEANKEFETLMRDL